MYDSSIRFILFTSFSLLLGFKQENKNSQQLPKEDTTELLNKEILNYSKSARKIDSLLNQKYKQGELNGNVLVVQNGDEVYQKSFGYTDGSKNTKLNENYRFNIGSVYKEFPAVSIMQLEEQGKLNLKDKLSKYIKDLPPWADSISIKSLLQYSSGLPEMKFDEHFSKGITVTEKIVMSDLKNVKRLEFKPETDYLYTNYSPLLLSKIVEKIANQDFQDYAQESIFNPYGLSQTKINKQYPYKDKTLMAIPFNNDFVEDDYKTTVSSVLYSSTTLDMYKWFKILDSFEILTKKSIEFLSEEAKIGNNIQAPLGLCDWKNDKIVEHSHHGSSASYECVVRRFKQKELTIVILTNQKHRNVYNISDEIIEILNQNM
ncbi:serine hydrolase domain-containing protein [Olivibacter domesticus]|uniref:CubicO group peptidase, beta-lactamase class C family n=1 Tax=Olivibacter domesticus TaxID=407022 RepID=A0A1H7JUH8_OLID1|nr:serine hydrolase domain-containing protein [Olivibacter domesticus]SEK77417.1 CubicO group peptidase, beta-lactamase class C family [Olivibacter domesticus]